MFQTMFHLAHTIKGNGIDKFWKLVCSTVRWARESQLINPPSANNAVLLATKRRRYPYLECERRHREERREYGQSRGREERREKRRRACPTTHCTGFESIPGDIALATLHDYTKYENSFMEIVHKSGRPVTAKSFVPHAATTDRAVVVSSAAITDRAATTNRAAQLSADAAALPAEMTAATPRREGGHLRRIRASLSDSRLHHLRLHYQILPMVFGPPLGQLPQKCRTIFDRVVPASGVAPPQMLFVWLGERVFAMPGTLSGISAVLLLIAQQDARLRCGFFRVPSSWEIDQQKAECPELTRDCTAKDTDDTGLAADTADTKPQRSDGPSWYMSLS
ncbi:hypothetical protein CONLIGDRAFT_684983 [Coniochaeta ligniaria NRRL 30616]|uniref:Uncharacterized protein n=1 Tax=Coniochaeta ligniaria NRRL 30616 TaxID=1408157 RepID=A0A1J7J5M9_9PEZI|nr:hypothetical protein CONLIGDRAFT_684983 [Coniochaeta ligniaria NRRL 30616]